jgi:isocitrate/isopropylmalate dehydrogenase
MNYKIAVIPGDGIGKEVIPASLEVLGAIGRKCGFELDFIPYEYSCECYKSTGSMMPKDGMNDFLIQTLYSLVSHLTMGITYSYKKGFSSICQSSASATTQRNRISS